MSRFNIPRSEVERLIDEWCFNERNRAILKRRFLDGVCFEPLAGVLKYPMATTYGVPSPCFCGGGCCGNI